MTGRERPRLRFALAGDDAALTTLLEAAYGASAPPVTRWRDQGLLAFAIVAEAPGDSADGDGGGRAAGLVACAAVADSVVERPDGDRTPVGLLLAVAAAPSARGRGLARDVARAALAQCRKRGFAAVVARGRHRLLDSLGFNRFAAERVTTPFPAEDVMAAALTDAAPSLRGALIWPTGLEPTRDQDVATSSAMDPGAASPQNEDRNPG